MTQTILGIDPGYDRCGWGVLAGEKRTWRAVEFGVITSPKALSRYERFAILLREITQILDTYTIQEVAMEELFFARNVNTALPVSEVKGIIYALAIQRQLPIFEYKPNVIKQTVTGYGRAEKAQVMQMVVKQLRLEKIPKIDDTGDALAVALTHAVHRSSKLLSA